MVSAPSGALGIYLYTYFRSARGGVNVLACRDVSLKLKKGPNKSRATGYELRPHNPFRIGDSLHERQIAWCGNDFVLALRPIKQCVQHRAFPDRHPTMRGGGNDVLLLIPVQPMSSLTYHI